MDHAQHNYPSGRAGHGAQGEPATAACSSAHETAARTRLTQNWVCLRFPKLPELSAGGIVLDGKRYYGNQDGSVPRDAVVVAVGPGKWVHAKGNRGRRAHFHPTTVRVGDRVLIDAMHTQEGLLSEWDGERGDFRLVREWAIVGVLDAGAVLEVA